MLLLTPPGADAALGSTSLTVDDGDEDCEEDEEDEDAAEAALAAATVAVGLFSVDESSCWLFDGVAKQNRISKLDKIRFHKDHNVQKLVL